MTKYILAGSIKYLVKLVRMKICSHCKKSLELSKFNIRKASSDGIEARCRDCRNEYRIKIAVQRSEYRKAYYEANKKKELANRAAYQKAFPEKCNAITMKCKAIQLKATPSWTDLKKVEEFYKKAQEQSELNKEPYQVHHVIPLVSKKVCGLHCEANLAVITATENHQIGNRHWPNMW